MDWWLKESRLDGLGDIIDDGIQIRLFGWGWIYTLLGPVQTGLIGGRNPRERVIVISQMTSSGLSGKNESVIPDRKSKPRFSVGFALECVTLYFSAHRRSSQMLAQSPRPLDS